MWPCRLFFFVDNVNLMILISFENFSELWMRREAWSVIEEFFYNHNSDIIMGTMASLITSLMIVYSIVYSGADPRKPQNSALLAFVWGIHRGPVKMFIFDDVIIRHACRLNQTTNIRRYIISRVTKALACHHTFHFKPDNKVHRANIEPIWGRQDPGGPHVGPMNFVIWGPLAPFERVKVDNWCQKKHHNFQLNSQSHCKYAWWWWNCFTAFKYTVC